MELGDLLSADTDLAAFVSLYRRIGIELDVLPSEGSSRWCLFLGEDHTDNRISGYACFFTRVEFDEEGKFLEQGFYE